jgi:hypothetical protein
MLRQGRQLHGWKTGNLHEEAARAQAAQVGVEYDADEFTIGIVANQSLKDRGGSKLFKNVGVAHRVLIRSDQTITCRWNGIDADDNPTFTVEAGIPFEEWRLEITDIFVTTTQVTNPIKVYLT